ncbi:MAG TPA: PD-(D/E)XK nuclease family protein [Thermoanaerobaculia bacterium]|nr:PD-(D/E)XK nuclease family protein [Thermoanaerobaculia bacterium]
MKLPTPAATQPITQLSPSVYEVLLQCRARGAWAAHGDRTAIPLLPHALLGTAFHATVEAANKGRLAGLDAEAQLVEARRTFDECVDRIHARAHPLLRAKFSAAERLPYYNLYRERAAVEALQYAGPETQSAERHRSAHTAGYSAAEQRLVSADGLIAGRPDLINLAEEEVVDYKTGPTPEGGVAEISAAEVRQLKLYAHLAQENGISVTRGVITRADGVRSSIDIPPEDAAREGRRARESLSDYNAHAGESFDTAAQPSPQGCRFCPCIPFCEPFWRSATPAWADQCGVHLEGVIRAIERASIQGVALTTICVAVTRGTVAAGDDAHVEQMPDLWIEADGIGPLGEGETVRIVYGRLASEVPSRVFRVDRVATSIWSVTSTNSASE